MKLNIYLLLLLLSLGIISCDNNNLILKQEYYPNGNIKKKYYIDNQGEITGLVEENYESGKLWLKYFIDNGVKNGTEEVFSEQGVRIKLSEYLNGLRHGTQIEYNTDGSISLLGKMNNGKKTGNLVTFYANGKLKHQMNFVNGVPVKHAMKYNEEGVLNSYQLYDTKGRLRYKREYSSDGSIVKQEGALSVVEERKSLEENMNQFAVLVAKPPSSRVEALDIWVKNKEGKVLQKINHKDTSEVLLHYNKIENIVVDVYVRLDENGAISEQKILDVSVPEVISKTFHNQN